MLHMVFAQRCPVFVSNQALRRKIWEFDGILKCMAKNTQVIYRFALAQVECTN